MRRALLLLLPVVLAGCAAADRPDAPLAVSAAMPDVDAAPPNRGPCRDGNGPQHGSFDASFRCIAVASRAERR